MTRTPPYPAYATPYPEAGSAPAPGNGDPRAGDGRAPKGLELKPLPDVVYQLWHRPVSHRYDITPEYPTAGEPVTVHVQVQEDGRVDGGRVRYTTDGTRPGADAPWVPLVPDGGVWDQEAFRFQSRWRAVLPAAPDGTVVRYEIEVTDRGVIRQLDDAGPPLMVPRLDRLGHIPPAREFAYQVGAATTPSWFRDAVVYHLMVSRFAAPAGSELAPEHEVDWMGFSGGTLAGLTQRLDWLADLGVDCLLLSPLHRGLLHLSYDVVDYQDVTPELGTLAEARELLDAAHARGMRVLLDFEASYLGWHHPFFIDACRDPESPYRDWFLWQRWPDEPLGFMGGEVLASLDHAHPDARAHVIDGARFWLELGFDGFRLDSAHGSSLDFWTDFGAQMRALNPDVVMLGEVVLPPPEVRRYHGRITTGVDFVLNNALRRTFANRTQDMVAFEHDLSALERYWPSSMVAPACFENHDQERFLYLAGDDRRRLELVTICMLTLPTTPILYYGSEIGLSHDREGDMDFTARRNMPWDDPDDDLRAHVRRLLVLRRRYSALRRGRRRTLHVEPDMLASAVELAGAPPVVTLLLNAPEGRELAVASIWPDGTMLRDVLGDRDVVVKDGTIAVELEAFGAVVLVAAAAEESP